MKPGIVLSDTLPISTTSTTTTTTTTTTATTTSTTTTISTTEKSSKPVTEKSTSLNKKIQALEAELFGGGGSDDDAIENDTIEKEVIFEKDDALNEQVEV